MKSKLNKLKYFTEELNQEGRDSDPTQDLNPPSPPSDPNFEPEPYVPNPDLVVTTNGREIKVAYDAGKNILALQVSGLPEPIKLHGQNIDQLIKVLQKARGNQ